MSCLALTEHVGKHCSNKNTKLANYRVKAMPQTIFGLFLFLCLPLFTFHHIPVAKKETTGKTLPSLLLIIASILTGSNAGSPEPRSKGARAH